MSSAERRRTEEHLESCDVCRGELASLGQTLQIAESLPIPERGENYGGEVWARIRPHLAEPGEKRWHWGVPFRPWALAGSVAVLLVAAFWGGRVWQQRHT